MNTKKATILVVEDDAAIRNGLLDVFTFNGYEAQGAEDGGEGLRRALENQFDLVLLDVMLPTMDGFSICRELRCSKAGQAIIMLTAKGSEDDIVNGFSAGADDYISKPFSLQELMVRVEAVLRRCGKNLGDTVLQVNGITFDGSNLTATADGNCVELTRREMDIIFYLHRNETRIVSKQEMLAEIWHYAVPDIETRTVDIHILKLRKKIQSLLGEQPFIVTIRGEGYRLEAER